MMAAGLAESRPWALLSAQALARHAPAPAVPRERARRDRPTPEIGNPDPPRGRALGRAAAGYAPNMRAALPCAILSRSASLTGSRSRKARPSAIGWKGGSGENM